VFFVLDSFDIQNPQMWLRAVYNGHYFVMPRSLLPRTGIDFIRLTATGHCCQRLQGSILANQLQHQQT